MRRGISGAVGRGFARRRPWRRWLLGPEKGDKNRRDISQPSGGRSHGRGDESTGMHKFLAKPALVDRILVLERALGRRTGCAGQQRLWRPGPVREYGSELPGPERKKPAKREALPSAGGVLTWKWPVPGVSWPFSHRSGARRRSDLAGPRNGGFRCKHLSQLPHGRNAGKGGIWPLDPRDPWWV